MGCDTAVLQADTDISLHTSTLKVETAHSLKRWYLATKPHYTTTEKTTVFTVTAIKTSKFMTE
jgi:hypothetical protein